MTIIFEDIRDKIVDALAKRVKVGMDEGYSLVEQFMYVIGIEQMPVYMTSAAQKCVPLVGLVGNETGQLYFYPLKTLLPDLDI